MTRRRTAKPNQKKQKQDILPLKWPQQKKLQTPSEILNKEKCEQETATTSTATTATATTTTKATRFFGCYLLTSLSPRFKGHTYIGFTVNPTRRIRQHNGEITSGAFRTKKKRPWEMVLCVHGFHTNVAALQFEWAWQHPKESIAVREAAASFKALGGLANKIKLALAMLTLHPWQSMNLTVSFFSTKYMKHAAGCPSLPCQMKLHFCSMDELPSYENSDQKDDYDDEDDYEPNDEVSANCSDERIESSADGSIEMDPYSVHFRSCTTHKSGDNSLEGDCRGIDGSLRSESSSVKGVVEEHMQPLHQLPVEVRGSSPNTPNDQLRPCEEIWTDDVRESFPILGENTHLSGVHTSDNEWPPFLEEKQFSCDLPADVPGSKGKYLNECSQLEKEIRAKELRGSFLIIEEHIHPFQHVCPPEREQSSKGDFVSGMEDVAKKDEITCIVIDDINEEQCQQTRAQSPIRISNIVHPFFNEGFEVIELCTPSPDVRITTGSRKRRAASEFPDFIDLTGSPSFVQL